MLRQMVKIANKLDSLGLTKEADVLDRYINKMAAAVTEGPGNVFYDEGRAIGAPGASLNNKFYASKPQTLSEFNGLLGQLIKEIKKIPGQDVFSKEIINLPPKEGDTTWSGATNVAFKEYAEAAGFREAGVSWKDFALKNRYQPTLFGIYKFWEDTIDKVVDKANSDFSTTFSIGKKQEPDIAPSPTPSPSPQATTGNANITEYRADPSYKPGTEEDADFKVEIESALK